MALMKWREDLCIVEKENPDYVLPITLIEAVEKVAMEG